MPRLQVFLFHSICSSGARLSGTSAHGETSLAILLMIFMTTGSKAIGGQGRYWTDSYAGPPLNLDWIWAVEHHKPSVCMFSWRSTAMNIIKPKTSRGLHLLPPLQTKGTLSRGGAKSDQFLGWGQNLVLSPLKPIHDIFGFVSKPYKCAGSEWCLYASFAFKGLILRCGPVSMKLKGLCMYAKLRPA